MPDRPYAVHPHDTESPSPGVSSGLVRRLRSIGLRSRLALLGLALILPWAVVTSLVVIGFRRDRERDGFARASEQARLVAARVDDQIRAVNALLLVLSRTAGATASDAAANDRLLRSLGDHLPGAFVNLAVWDSGGRNVGVSFEEPDLASQARAVNAGDRRFFRDAMTGRERVVGELVRTVRTGRWGLSLGQPIMRGERVVGVVSATAFVDLMGALLAAGDDELPRGSVISLLDEGGRVLARTGDAGRSTGRRELDSADVGAVRREKFGRTRLSMDDSVTRLVAYRALHNAPWIVVSSIDADESLAAAHAEARFGFLVAALSLGLALVLAWLVARGITEPLARLSVDATALGAGDLARRADVSVGGEVAELARAFNSMAATVETRTEALLASEARYRLLFEASPMPMWVVELDSLRFVAVNEAAVRHYGWSRDEFLSMSLLCIRPEEEVPATLHRVRDGHQPGVPSVVRHRRKDGSILLAEVVTHDVGEFDGRPARLAVAMDATERLAAERALRETNDALQTLIQASPLAIVTTDRDGLVREWNVAAERMFAWPAGDVLGRAVPFSIERTGVDGARRPSGWDAGGYEARVERRDGGLAEVSAYETELRDGGGQPTGAMFIFADVSERHAIEEQLRQAQKMEAVGQLAGGVAHDFNNLLTVITSYAQFLLAGIPKSDPLHGDARHVLDAAQRAAQLTRQLLAFSRRQVLQPRALCLNTVLADMQPLLRRLLGGSITLVAQTEQGIGTVRADRGQLEQVLMNLVVNARDAMPAGGVVSITTRSVVLDAAWARRHSGVRPGRYVMLAVRDTGVGMDAATQERVFEPFFTTKEIGKGTGLGLSTVYGIVQQSGGHIVVRSAPGQGATFEIYLPWAGAEAAPAAEAEPPAELPRGTETVLLVEDEPQVRIVVRRALESLGYSVVEARDGHEALRTIGERRGGMALVLTDVVMPGMGGRELARRLAAEHPEIRLLFISGYSDASSPVTAHAPLLAKPFTPEALARAVRSAIDAPREERPAPAGAGALR